MSTITTRPSGIAAGGPLPRGTILQRRVRAGRRLHTFAWVLDGRGRELSLGTAWPGPDWPREVAERRAAEVLSQEVDDGHL